MRAMFSMSVAKYRPHRPHRLHCVHLQDFLAVGTTMSFRPPGDRYRPLSKVPPAYGPTEICCLAAVLCSF